MLVHQQKQLSTNIVILYYIATAEPLDYVYVKIINSWNTNFLWSLFMDNIMWKALSHKRNHFSFAELQPITDKDLDNKCFSWGNLATHGLGTAGWDLRLAKGPTV